EHLIVSPPTKGAMLIARGIQQLLIRRPFLRNLLHKLFSANQPLLNQQLRQGVGLREAGDEKLFHRDRSFIWFWHCTSSLYHLLRSNHHHRWNRQAESLGSLEVDQQFKLSRLLDWQVGRLCSS